MASDDPIDAKRERYRQQSAAAQRLAYGTYAVATVLFFFGLFTTFRPWLVTVIVGALILASVVLAIAIQVAYAVRGAERHEEDARTQRRRR